MKTRPTKFHNCRSGQTAVEMMLLIAVVVGIVTAGGKLAGPGLESAIASLVREIQSSGWTGGYPVGNTDRPLEGHYSPGEACMSVSGGGSSC